MKLKLVGFAVTAVVAVGMLAFAQGPWGPRVPGSHRHGYRSGASGGRSEDVPQSERFADHRFRRDPQNCDDGG